MLFKSFFSKVPFPCEPAAPEGTGVNIRFDAARIAAGVVFHLLDEGLATSVDVAAVLRTVRRLVEQNVHAQVARGAWHAMSGRERLEWLLRHGRTRAIILRDGSAALMPAPKTLW